MATLEEAEAKIKANPQNLWAWIDKIEFYDEDEIAGLKVYDEMVTANPENAEAWQMKADYLETIIKNPQEALQCFQKALEIEPDNEEAQEGIKRCSK